MPNRSSVHKTLLRWSIIVAPVVAFVVPAVVTEARMREAASKAAMCRAVEVDAAALLKVATDPDERRELRERIVEHARLRAEWERRARWPW